MTQSQDQLDKLLAIANLNLASANLALSASCLNVNNMAQTLEYLADAEQSIAKVRQYLDQNDERKM